MGMSMMRFGQRLAAVVAAFVLLTAIGAGPAIAKGPTWSHRDAAVCGAQAAGHARCASIARALYVDGDRFQAKSKSDIARAAAAAQTAYFHGPDLRTAYGITGQGDPSRVIAIVDAYDDPNAYSNLTRFRTDQGLPAIQSCSLATLTSLTSAAANPCFTKTNQTGGTSLPRADAGWANEIDLDLQAASAVCPKCSILLLEATSNSVTNLAAAVTTASNTAHVLAISNSYGVSGDYPATYAPAYDNAAKKGIAVTASAGDGGYGLLFPASATNVIGVGGTHLNVDAAGVRTTETVWSGTGSGCSIYNAAPAWQTIAGDPCGTKKAISDLSADADPGSGLAIYTTYGGSTGYWVFGGTSLSSPLIAALYTMQGGYGGATLAGQFAWAAATPYFDVTSGSNGSCSPSILCTAGTGWDGPTGRGSIAAATIDPPVLKTVKVTPATVSLPTGGSQQFTATAYDQYGVALASQPTFSWSVDSGVGSIDASSGLYAAGPTEGSATVSASSGSVSGTAGVTVANAVADFSLSVSPASRTIKRGATTTFAVTVTPANGFTGAVTLSVTGQPAGSTVTFSANPTTGSATLTIKPPINAARQTYLLSIKGVSGSLVHTAGASLTITK